MGVLILPLLQNFYYAFLKHEDPKMNRFYNSSGLIKFKADLGPDCQANFVH